MSDIATLRRILEDTKTVAVVGLSANWYRPSFFAAKYMQAQGYRIIPVNPGHKEMLGERCYPDLKSIPEQVDMVDCFRHGKEMLSIAQDAIAIGAKTLWMQIGVENEEARALAERNGLEVVENRCVKIEYARLFGGLNFCGVNTGIVSSKRPLKPPRAFDPALAPAFVSSESGASCSISFPRAGS